MANIASVLKAEIARVARKEVRAEVETLKRTSVQHRTAIAQLRRQVVQLEKELKATRRQASAASRPVKVASTSTTRRFSAARLAAHRAKVGLSAAEYGKLVGMSGATIYLWEQGKSRPSADHLERLAKVREMGKQAIQTELSAR